MAPPQTLSTSGTDLPGTRHGDVGRHRGGDEALRVRRLMPSGGGQEGGATKASSGSTLWQRAPGWRVPIGSGPAALT